MGHLLPVRCSCGACDTWSLVELQGEVELTDGEALDGLDVGVLCCSAPVR
jgi:DNA-directed RNA polymerase subunit N (RpoN/RPB10)